MAGAVVGVVAVVGAVLWWPHGAQPSATWQPPTQTVLASSMRVAPVTGWTSRVDDLGLPDGARIATDAQPFESSPFVGNVGDSAYFVAGSPVPTGTQWWLVGIDVRTGDRLFAPVRLDAGRAEPKCFLNGPDAVLCLRDSVADGHVRSGTAWVVDGRSGAVSFTGPTDLRTQPPTLRVQQVGIHAVAETASQGVFGIGATAETTWFVPGDGSVDQKYATTRDVAAVTVVSQSEDRASGGKVVFSVADGSVVQLDVASDAEAEAVVVYPGGFAAAVAVDRGPAEVQFFDDSGRRTGRDGVRGVIGSGSADLPLVGLVGDGWAGYTPAGGELVRGQGDVPSESRLIGDVLFVRDHGDGMVRRWQRYDLRTGTQGSACDHDLGAGYLGTDGSVAVIEAGNPNVGLVTRGVDLASCVDLWTIRSPIGSFRDVWRVDTTLVELSDDASELASLVAPG